MPLIRHLPPKDPLLLRLTYVSAEHVASLSPRLNILRHGLDDDLVMLREDGRAARKEGAK